MRTFNIACLPQPQHWCPHTVQTWKSLTNHAVNAWSILAADFSLSTMFKLIQSCSAYSVYKRELCSSSIMYEYSDQKKSISDFTKTLELSEVCNENKWFTSINFFRSVVFIYTVPPAPGSKNTLPPEPA